MEPWMDLSKAWGYILDVSAQRLVNNKTRHHVSRFGEKIEVIGAAGELAARRFLGVRERLHVHWDGGVDIWWNGLRIDVKGTELDPDRRISLQWPLKKFVKCDIALLTVIDLDHRLARVQGYAFRKEVYDAQKNFCVPYPCWEIPASELRDPKEVRRLYAKDYYDQIARSKRRHRPGAE